MEGKRRSQACLLLLLAPALLALIVLSQTRSLPSPSLLDSSEDKPADDAAPEGALVSDDSQEHGAKQKTVVTVINQPVLPVAAELQHVQAILKKLKTKISSFQTNEEEVGNGLKQSIERQKLQAQSC